MLYAIYRVLSSKLTRISVAANVDRTEPPTPMPLLAISVTVGMQGKGERGRGREGGERERDTKKLTRHFIHIYYYFVHQGMLVNDSLGRQIMKLQQLILTSEVSYSVYSSLYLLPTHFTLSRISLQCRVLQIIFPIEHRWTHCMLLFGSQRLSSG